MTPVELKRFVRFGIAQLRADNAHHQFEEICRYAAAERICQNVIPATGPVGAFGDQGRDFETFRVFFNRDSDRSMFVGSGDSQIIVFACTLQQDRVEQKIRADIEAIISEPDLPVDAIVAFCEADLAIGRRNTLRSEARRTHGVDLQIFDGNGIAELLCMPETAWIAQRFLSLPAELVPIPRGDADDTWYLAQRAKWGERELPRPVWGDFADIKSCLRFVYQSGRFGEDFDWWLDLLGQFKIEAIPLELRRAAVYESAIASIRARETFEPFVEDLAWYFDGVLNVIASGELEDAQALLGFAFGSLVLERGGLEPDLVEIWRRMLIVHLDAQIASTDNPARLCSLFMTRGALELFHLGDRSFDDIRRFWQPGLECADSATLFLVERFADVCVPIALAFAHEPSFQEFVTAVDVKVAAQAGAAVVAEHAQERGLALAAGNRLALALREFHAAKDSWLESHDTGGALSAIGMIATCYRSLNLYYAAKHYYLALVFVAVNSPDESHRHFVAHGLLKAADCDYATGAWAGFCALAELGLVAHGAFDIDPGDERHSVLTEVAFDAGYVSAIAEAHFPSFSSQARTIASALLPEDLLESLQNDPPAWLGDLSDVTSRFIAQLGARPFEDCAEQRVMAWSAFGINWNIRVSTDRSTTIAAERFAAAAQVVHADLALFDMCTLPIIATAELVLGERSTVAQSDRIGTDFEISVAPWTDGDHDDFVQLSIATVSAVVTMTGMTSLLAMADVLEIVERCFASGLSNKVAVAKPYDELLGLWLTEDRFDSPSRDATFMSAYTHPYVPPSHEDLAWSNGPGPGYSLDVAREFLENRYENLSRLTCVTMRRLRSHSPFLELATRLKGEGWLDWHLLGAVHSIVHTFRTQPAGPLDRESLKRMATVHIVDEPEGVAPVPLEEFSEEAIRRAHEVNNITTLITTWDRVLHLNRTAIDPVNQVLGERYRHYLDDVEHEDPLEV